MLAYDIKWDQLLCDYEVWLVKSVGSGHVLFFLRIGILDECGLWWYFKETV